MLSVTSSPPHLIVLSTFICLLYSTFNHPPLLPFSHLSYRSPPISASASLASSCPHRLTLGRSLRLTTINLVQHTVCRTVYWSLLMSSHDYYLCRSAHRERPSPAHAIRRWTQSDDNSIVTADYTSLRLGG